jgi:transposase
VGASAWKLQIVKRSDAADLPKRWIVERTFARISRCRLARDVERYVTTVAAFIRLAMIRIMLRRLAATINPNFPGRLLVQRVIDGS